MISLIQSAHNREFLLFYILFSSVLITAGLLLKKSAAVSGRRADSASELDALSVLILKEKVSAPGLIRFSLLSLFGKGAVSMDGKKGNAVIKRSAQSFKDGNSLENAIFASIKESSSSRDILKNSSLAVKANEMIRSSETALKIRTLLVPDETASRLRMSRRIIVLLILALGGIRIFNGLSHGYPSVFIILLTIASVVTAIILLRIPRQTTAGKEKLAQLTTQNQWLKDKFAHNDTHGADPLMAAAIFGIGVLALSSAFDPYTEAYPPDQKNNGGCSAGSCSGTGCSGASCSGSSCSGGGCGGGD